MRKNRPSSGNGSSKRQWLYLAVNLPFVLFFKIGISGDYKRRNREINRAAFGYTVPVFAVKVPFAWQCEQAMHRSFSWFNIYFGGSKEWFLFPVVPFALLIMVTAWLLDWAVLALLAFLAVWGMAGTT